MELLDTINKRGLKEEEERNLTAVLLKEDGQKIVQTNPMKYLNNWDFIILFSAVFLRLVIALNVKNEEVEAKGEKFSFSKYWDFKHITRWFTHALTSLLVIMVLPEFFVDVVQKRYFSELTEWTLFGSGITGFLGYDSIKIFERTGVALFEKIGVKFKSNEETKA